MEGVSIWVASAAIPQLLQVSVDRGIKLATLSNLLSQRHTEPHHFLLERFAVVLLRLRAHVAPGVSTWPYFRISSSAALLQKPGTSRYSPHLNPLPEGEEGKRGASTLGDRRTVIDLKVLMVLTLRALTKLLGGT